MTIDDFCAAHGIKFWQAQSFANGAMRFEFVRGDKQFVFHIDMGEYLELKTKHYDKFNKTLVREVGKYFGIDPEED